MRAVALVALAVLLSVGSPGLAGVEEIVLEVSADGSYRLGGQPTILPAIGNHVQRRTEAHRGVPPRVVVRADPRAPWGAVRRLLRHCAEPPRRLPGAFLAVSFTAEPILVLLSESRWAELARKDAPILPVRLRSGGPPADPEALPRATRRVPLEHPAWIDLDATVPTGMVIRTVEALHRGGAKAIRIVDPPIEREGPTGDSVGVEVFARSVGKAGDDDRDAPRPDGRPTVILRPPPTGLSDLFELLRGVPGPGSGGPKFGGGCFGGRLQHRGLRTEGGDDRTEHAVAGGLHWLAATQEPTGGWGEGSVRSTGLALLAFLGACHTPHHGTHRTAVLRGLGHLFRAEDGERSSEARAIAALALVEAYAMTGDPVLKRRAQRSVDGVLARIRAPDGDASRDRRASGWEILALKIAKAAGGLVLPGDTWLRLNVKLDRAATTPGALGVAVLTRLYTGENPNDDGPMRQDVDRCVAALEDGPPELGLEDRHFVSLAMFQIGREPWKRWNEAAKAVLLPLGARSGEPGLVWDAEDPRGNRVDSTALAVLTLETYYRYGRIWGIRRR